MKLSKKARKLIACMVTEIILAIAICYIDKILPGNLNRLIVCLLKLILVGGLIGVYARIQRIIKN